jgi:hypothetical protein
VNPSSDYLNRRKVENIVPLESEIGQEAGAADSAH